jgi:hypothetical protein
MLNLIITLVCLDVTKINFGDVQIAVVNFEYIHATAVTLEPKHSNQCF